MDQIERATISSPELWSASTADPAPSAPGVVVMAQGDQDDHLRITALIAAGLGESAGSRSEELQEAYRLCLYPGSSWSDRFTSLGRLLDGPVDAAASRAQAAFVDPDALYVGALDRESRWNDHGFRAARDELLTVMLAAATRGGWTWVRPAPHPELSRRLAAAGLSQRPLTGEARPIGSWQAKVQPVAWPMVEWLLRERRLDRRSLDDAVAEAEGDELTEHLVFLTFEAQPPWVRRMARKIAVLRPPQPVNGALGPFDLVGSTTDHLMSVSRSALEGLVVCGLVVPDQDSGHLHMPRIIRRYVATMTDADMDPEIRAIHAVLGAREVEEADVESSIERHFHAVRAEDVDQAIRTARFYANDLRGLAFRLSSAEKFAEAARAYQAIVEVDPSDAYAWEYLAYNLARSGQPRGDDRLAARVLEAYREAKHLDSRNPLFWGRYTGFRAELGDDVRKDFGRLVNRFERSDGIEGVQFLAEPILKGFIRADRKSELAALRAEPWWHLLRRSPRLVQLLGKLGL